MAKVYPSTVMHLELDEEETATLVAALSYTIANTPNVHEKEKVEELFEAVQRGIKRIPVKM